MDDLHSVRDLGAGWYFVSRPRGLGVLFQDRDRAQEWCDHINAVLALDRRKNAALEWALTNGVPHEEIHAALRTPDNIGLLDFEVRMCDTPTVVVLGEAPE